MQDLKEKIIYFRDITITSINNFIIKFKVNLELFINNQ